MLTVLHLLWAVPAPGRAFACPAGYTRHGESPPQCYAVKAASYVQLECEAACAADNASLACLSSAEETAWLQAWIGHYLTPSEGEVWIGHYRVSGENGSGASSYQCTNSLAVQTNESAADSGAAIAQFQEYPNYIGPYEVEAMATLSEASGTLVMKAYLSGLEPRASGGIHIREGFGCTRASGSLDEYAGGHYYDGLSVDPWTTTYTADSQGVAHVELSLPDFSLEGVRPVAGRVIVVHLSATYGGARAACGVIVPSNAVVTAPPADGVECTLLAASASIESGAYLSRGCTDERTSCLCEYPGRTSSTYLELLNVSAWPLPEEEEAAAVSAFNAHIHSLGAGLAMGMIHAVTGPDHMSALITIAVNQRCAAVWLGFRWGVGHSLVCSRISIPSPLGSLLPRLSASLRVPSLCR